MKYSARPTKWIQWATVLSGIGALTAMAYVLHSTLAASLHISQEVTSNIASSAPSGSAVVTLKSGPYLLFRYTGLGATYGKLAFVPLTQPESSPTMADIACDRVHFAAGRGVCLSARRGVFTTYEAIVFDAALQILYKRPLRGAPSRVRVSPDGRFAAMTVFVSGHSYAVAGFSTHTSILDLQTGEFIAPDLEKFTVWRDGERFQAIDFNFWGVTFGHDSQHFYATLGTGGHTYLIAGDVSTQEAWVRRNDIECPSLSPDNTRIAFKKRVGGTWGPVIWRLAVLDLTTHNEWLLAETRAVDDQAEWLDNDTILYALPDRTTRTATMHTWAVDADGGGEPRRLVPHASSPVVARPRQTKSAQSN